MEILRGDNMNKKSQSGMNKNKKHISKKSILNCPASRLKFLPALAVFFILFTIAVHAADVTIENGRIDVNGNLYVDLTGRVGIGTTIPSQKLTVVGTVESTSGGFKFPDGTTQITAASGGGGGSSQWTTSGSDIYYNAGKVGVGTASPSSPINVLGNSGDSNTGTLIIGSNLSSNLRMGYNTAGNYSWIQSHFGQPLRINELGNNVILNSGGGNVGIGTTSPSEKLHVNGNVLATAYYYSSDASLKTNVQKSDGLKIISGLDGVSFNWKDTGKADFGLIAQDVEKVLPELVVTDYSTGLKSVKYGNIVAPLIEATKELEEQNKNQSIQIAELEKEINLLRSELKEIKSKQK